MSKTSKTLAFTGGAVALAIAFAVPSLAAPVQSMTPPSVLAMSQKIKNGEVNVTYAFAPKDGVLAIYGSDAKGHIDKTLLGSTPITAGDHRDVHVKLSAAPAPGAKLWAVLEQSSASGKTAFKTDGKPVEENFKAM